MNDVFKGINNQKKNLSLTLLNIYLIETDSLQTYAI